jgi:hypothetical protein
MPIARHVEADMPVIWEQIGVGFYATAGIGHGRNRYYLVADKPAKAGWDWSVWRQGYDWRLMRNGVAATAQEAMRAAERVVTP